jgi:hypothetical protein
MRMKTGDLKRLGKTGIYQTTTGYTMTLHQNGVIGARSPDCDYTELEEKASDIREAKRLFVAWANRHSLGWY